MTDELENLNAPAFQAVAYVPITDTEIEPKKPGSSQLMTKLRDNPLAIAEGDPTAPRIQGAAFADDSLPLEKLISYDTDVVFNINPSSIIPIPIGFYLADLSSIDSNVFLEVFRSGSWMFFLSSNSPINVFEIASTGNNYRLNNNTGQLRTTTFRRFF